MATNNAVNVSLTGQSGTGAFAGTTSPVFVTPTLGTPVSGNLINCTGYPAVTSVSGAGLATGTVTSTGNITVTAATQSDQETGTSNTVAVTPGVQKFHPAHPKAWVYFTTVTTTTINGSFGVTSLTDGGTGITQVNYTTTFSSSNNNVNFWANDGTNRTFSIMTTNSNSSCTVRSTNDAGTLTDMAYNMMSVWGDI